MAETIDVKVVAVKDDDSRLNFNFVSENRGESWGLGPLKSSTPIPAQLAVGDRLRATGDWVRDPSGATVFFFATHIAKLK